MPVIPGGVTLNTTAPQDPILGGINLNNPGSEINTFDQVIPPGTTVLNQPVQQNRALTLAPPPVTMPNVAAPVRPSNLLNDPNFFNFTANANNIVSDANPTVAALPPSAIPLIPDTQPIPLGAIRRSTGPTGVTQPFVSQVPQRAPDAPQPNPEQPSQQQGSALANPAQPSRERQLENQVENLNKVIDDLRSGRPPSSGMPADAKTPEKPSRLKRVGDFLGRGFKNLQMMNPNVARFRQQQLADQNAMGRSMLVQQAISAREADRQRRLDERQEDQQAASALEKAKDRIADGYQKEMDRLTKITAAKIAQESAQTARRIKARADLLNSSPEDQDFRSGLIAEFPELEPLRHAPQNQLAAEQLNSAVANATKAATEATKAFHTAPEEIAQAKSDTIIKANQATKSEATTPFEIAGQIAASTKKVIDARKAQHMAAMDLASARLDIQTKMIDAQWKQLEKQLDISNTAASLGEKMLIGGVNLNDVPGLSQEQQEQFGAALAQQGMKNLLGVGVAPQPAPQQLHGNVSQNNTGLVPPPPPIVPNFLPPGFPQQFNPQQFNPQQFNPQNPVVPATQGAPQQFEQTNVQAQQVQPPADNQARLPEPLPEGSDPAADALRGFLERIGVSDPSQAEAIAQDKAAFETEIAKRQVSRRVDARRKEIADAIEPDMTAESRGFEEDTEHLADRDLIRRFVFASHGKRKVFNRLVKAAGWKPPIAGQVRPQPSASAMRADNSSLINDEEGKRLGGLGG